MTADYKDDKLHAQHTEHFDPAAKDVNNTSSDASLDLEALDVDEKRLVRKM